MRIAGLVMSIYPIQYVWSLWQTISTRLHIPKGRGLCWTRMGIIIYTILRYLWFIVQPWYWVPNIQIVKNGWKIKESRNKLTHNKIVYIYFICMCIYIYTLYMCVFIYVNKWIHLYIYVNIFMYICIYIYM